MRTVSSGFCRATPEQRGATEGLSYARGYCRAGVVPLLVHSRLVEAAAKTAVACSSLSLACSSRAPHPAPSPWELQHKSFSSCCYFFLLAQAPYPHFTLLPYGRAQPLPGPSLPPASTNKGAPSPRLRSARENAYQTLGKVRCQQHECCAHSVAIPVSAEGHVLL